MKPLQNIPFDLVWNLKSVTRIRADLIRGKEHKFLCLISSEFSLLWDNLEYREEIAKLARAFKPCVPGKKDKVWNKDRGKCLFYVHNSEDYKIRLDFLDYEIARLSAKK